eukprot:c14095_g1_i1.p1 GENE.c14095_g1_i1~~c14095_g1_i1.p1  ORF type:complete len:138 (+),score=19.65 c14095_g1_i1:72-485(+)
MLDSLQRVIIGVPLVAVFISIAASSGIAPIQELLISEGCKKHNIEVGSQACRDSDEAKAFASTHLFWLILATYVPQLFGIACVAHATDVYGRRFGVCLSASACACSCLLVAVVPIEYFYPVLLPCNCLANFPGSRVP